MTWWRRFFDRRRLDRELDAELRDHVERLAADYMRRGLSAREARRRALVDFGGVEGTKVAVRGARGTAWLFDLGRDVRMAVRSLRATPSFTFVALTVLALGIGATTAIYSVVDAVVLKPLPFDQPDRLMAVEETHEPSHTTDLVTPQNFYDWRERQDVFTGLAAIAPYATLSLKGDASSNPEAFPVQVVTADFFTVLRVTPILGRPLEPRDERDSTNGVVVISYGLWQRDFGGTPDVIGRTLHGQLRDFTIVGVMPRAFVFPVGSLDPADAWLPLVPQPGDRVRGHDFGNTLQVVGRLRPSVTVHQAQARLDQITTDLARTAPRSWFEDRWVKIEPLRDALTDDVRPWMFLLLAAVTCVLAIACVNVANLLLVRTTTRARDLGVRSALGASRWDLSRAVLVESLILSLVGTALGVLFAALALDLVRALLPRDLPRIAAIAINLRVLVAAAITAIGTSVACALGPIVRIGRADVTVILNEKGRASTGCLRRSKLGASLVVAEVGLAVVLLVGSALFLASFARVTRVDLGIDYRNVLTMDMRPIDYGTVTDPQIRRAIIERNARRFFDVLDRIRAIPGVEAAAILTGGSPIGEGLRTMDFGIPGRALANQDAEIDLNQVSPDYFAVLRVPLLEGRVFSDADRDSAEPTVILNEAAAIHYFPDGHAIGAVVTVGKTNRRVIGVGGDIRHGGPEGAWRRGVFVPFTTENAGGLVLVRTSKDADAFAPAIEAAIWSAFPNLWIPTPDTLEQSLAALIAPRRLNMILLTVFGVVGLVIAATGLYGVMAYSVTQRTQEIGIRMALGAAPAAVLREVLGRAAIYLGSGLAIGLVGAWELARFTEAFLFHVTPHELALYVAAAAVLAAAGFIAAFVPARRAARVDPLVALRAE